jgi:GntR family transcriptional regulator
MEIQVSKNSHVPVYVQIEEQIRFAIATGSLRNGERLPSIRGLAQKLGVNVNTVSKVYQRLQEQGLIVTRGAKGAFVSASFREHASRGGEPGLLRQQNVDLVKLVDATIADALRAGHKLAELQCVFNERIEASQSKADLPVVAFVECSETEASDYVQDLRSRFQANFKPVVLSDLEQDPALVQSADLVVTTLFHLGQVKDLVGKMKQVVGVVVNTRMEVLQQLSSLPAGTRLGGVCRDEESLMTMRSFLEYICTSDVEISICTLKDKAALEAVLSNVDALVYTPPCRAEIEALVPADLTSIEDRSQIDADSLRFLKEKIDNLSPGAFCPG